MKDKNNNDKPLEVPQIYTSIKILSRAYSILVDVGVEGLISGKFDTGVDFVMLAKQYAGTTKFNKNKVDKELKKASDFVYEIINKLLGEEKLIELYEEITKTKVTEENDPDIEIVLEAVANFFFAIVRKVPRFLAKMFILQKERS